MAETPNGTTIKAVSAAGKVSDVTEGVQVLYDLVLSSMDWGSGFLTVEDAIPVAEVAETCGFQPAEEPRRYLLERRRHDRLAELRGQGMDFHAATEQALKEIPDG